MALQVRRLFSAGLRYGFVVFCDLLFLPLVPLSKELLYWLDVERVKRSSRSTRRRYLRKVSLDPLLWDGLEVKVPKNAHRKTLRVEKSMTGDCADSGGVSKHQALETQDSLGETCFHNRAAPQPTGVKRFQFFGADLRSRCQDSECLRR